MQSFFAEVQTVNGKYVLLIVLALVSVSAYAVVSDSDGADASDGDGVTYAFDSGILTVSGTGAMADYASASDAPWSGYKDSAVSIVVGSGITKVGSAAFEGFSAAESVTISDTVVSLGAGAFKDCTGIKTLTMPMSLNAAASHSSPAFSGCTGIEKITFTGTGDGYNYSANTDNDYYQDTPWYLSKEKLTEIVIENGVTSIGKNAFMSCTALTSLTIGSGVTSIGMSAFMSCTALTSLTIGNGVTSIGNMAFCSCTALSSVVISDSVQTIESWAFVECALEKIYFGTGLTTVASDAFDISTFKDGETEISITDLDSFKGHIFTIDSSTYTGTKQTTYRISFVADGTVAAMIPYLSGETVTAPAVPEKEGYTGVWESYELENSDSQTVNAVYTAIMIDVKFLSEDGETVAAEYCLRYGQSIVLPETPVKESTVQYDYVFSGWDGYTAGDTAGVSDVTYTARFEPSVRSYQYTVVYSDAYHNSFLPSVTGTAVYGDSVSPSPAEYPGVEAVRMEIASVGGDGSTSYSAVSSVTVAGEGTVIYWIYAAKEYTVTYEVDGVQYGDTETYLYGTKADIRDAYTETGYTVTPWTADGVTVTDGKYSMPSHDVVFSANSVANTHNVYFMFDDGSLFCSESDIPYGETVAAPDEVPGKKSDKQYTYAFAGWEGLTDGTVMDDEDMFFRAVFTETPVQYGYTVSYTDARGNVLREEFSGKADYGSSVTPEVPEITGYDSPSARVLNITDNTAGNNLTYVYAPSERFAVTYIAGGWTVYTDHYLYGEEVTVRDVFKKVGYTGLDWETDDVEVADGKFTITSDVTFTADLSTNTHYATFVIDEDFSVPSAYLYGETITAPSGTPTKDSDGKYTYTFAGWDGFTEGMTMGDEDAVFTAIFTATPVKVAYTVRFLDTSGNEIADPVTGTADYGSVVSIAPVSVSGYFTPDASSLTITEDADANVLTYTYRADPGVYTIVFDDGTKKTSVTYTRANPVFTVPAVTEKTGYAGVWESYELEYSETQRVSAVYTMIVCTLTFDDGTKQTEVTYTADTGVIVAPGITAKIGYSAVWEAYSRDYVDRTVYAVYTPNTYHVSFVLEDGSEFYGYDLEYGKTIAAPSDTPAKDSDGTYTYTFSGWKGFTAGMTLGDSDAVFTAVFTEHSSVGGSVLSGSDADAAVSLAAAVSAVLVSVGAAGFIFLKRRS